MSGDRFQAELEAYQSLNELMGHAERCRSLFERAHIDPPEPLKRILGMGEVAGRRDPAATISLIPSPAERISPKGAGNDWISIPARDAGATSVVLAILRPLNEPIRVGDLIAKVNRVNPRVSQGGIANIGTRLGGEVISKLSEGWALVSPEKAPILENDRLWASPEMLTVHELAAHRREAIIHLLSHFSSGLELVQMVEQLANCQWVKAPVNKDLVDDDIKALAEDRKIRRRGNTRKWELMPEGQD